MNMNEKEVSKYLELIDKLQKEKVGDPKDLENMKVKLTHDKDLEEAYLKFLTDLEVRLQKKYQTPKRNFSDITDVSKRSEIAQIADRLDEDEKVIMVIRQTKNPLKPGSSLITPDTIFATTKKIIIRNPSAFGLRQNIEIYKF